MDIVIVVLLLVIIVLEICLLLKKTDNVKATLAESENRIINNLDKLSQNENRNFNELSQNISTIKSDMTEKMNDKFVDMIKNDNEGYKTISSELNENINKMNEALLLRLSNIRDENGKSLENINSRLIASIKENADNQQTINTNLSESLTKIQSMTEEKLNTIQKNVNDKLDVSLNKRLDESFDRVTKQLGELYKSLGELGEMSDGIANLNKTLSNVKTRGTWGEIQLGSILEDTMTESQYVKNIKLKKNSDDIVEYAIKIPSKNNEDESIYLPIDSKFPLDVYGTVLEAAEASDKALYDRAVKDLGNRIKEEARTIRDKYIMPPVTTDFAIMFLPTESLYAEVLRINGLAETCQNQYRIIIASPSTITALLNSLKVGFANVALNKKTAEVRKLLEAVKSQYSKLDELIDATKKKLEDAVKSNEKLKDRADKIQRSMSKVNSIDEKEADTILGMDSVEQTEV